MGGNKGVGIDFIEFIEIVEVEIIGCIIVFIWFFGLVVEYEEEVVEVGIDVLLVWMNGVVGNFVIVIK